MENILRKVNFALIAAIIGVNGYLVIMPFLPAVKSQVAIHVTKPVKVNPDSKASLKAVDRSKEHIVIPSIQLDTPFYEGPTAETTYQGVWHLPQSSSPDKGGNTVMAGHRFSYKKPASAYFYNLDKVKTGDDVVVAHKGDIYHYKVKAIQTVLPNAKYIEATAEPMLTLYTCTPLWSVNHRLVVQAPLVEVL